MHPQATQALQLQPLPPALSWADLAVHRSYLVQFARRRLMDPALAEDLVHDVFEAVVTGRAAFAGRSALRSWLVAILKHKIVDLVRQRVGHDSLDTAEGEDGPGPMFECPQPRPDDVAEQRQRLRRTLVRIGELPDTLRQVIELACCKTAAPPMSAARWPSASRTCLCGCTAPGACWPPELSLLSSAA